MRRLVAYFLGDWRDPRAWIAAAYPLSLPAYMLLQVIMSKIQARREARREARR